MIQLHIGKVSHPKTSWIQLIILTCFVSLASALPLLAAAGWWRLVQGLLLPGWKCFVSDGEGTLGNKVFRARRLSFSDATTLDRLCSFWPGRAQTNVSAWFFSARKASCSHHGTFWTWSAILSSWYPWWSSESFAGPPSFLSWGGNSRLSRDESFPWRPCPCCNNTWDRNLKVIRNI